MEVEAEEEDSREARKASDMKSSSSEEDGGMVEYGWEEMEEMKMKRGL